VAGDPSVEKKTMLEEDFDVVIVGGGPAGLTAALVLGRCRRRVVVIDSGRPRNRRAGAGHGFFTRDGAKPQDLIRIGREQLAQYDVVLHDDEAVAVAPADGGEGWVVKTKSGRTFRGKKALLATGMCDRLPDIPGVERLFGKSIHVCPYCDGWEARDLPFGVVACDPGRVDFTLGLLTWSEDVVLFLNGDSIGGEDRACLERNGVRIVDERIAELEGDDELTAVRLENGNRVERRTLFVHLGQDQAAPFARDLGCPTIENGAVCTSKGERAGPKGLFVAGDASHDLQVIAVAVSEGMKAACAINMELRQERYR
jgi:thioredoxin reductase